MFRQRLKNGGLLILLTCAAVLSARGDLALLTKWPVGGNACVDTPLRLTFDQPPTLGRAGKIEVRRVSDGTAVETLDVGDVPAMDRFTDTGGWMMRYEPVRIEGNTACIRLRTGALRFGETYAVSVGAGVFEDGAGNVFAGIPDSWKFQVKAALPREADRLVVAADGTADFCTVQGAVDQVEPHRERPTVIFIRKGCYHELVRVGRAKTHVQLVGEDRQETVIAATNNDQLRPGWLPRAVLGVEGDDFALDNLTVQNTTPYKGSQAEAVYVNAERCVLQNSRFLSFQDTLNLSGRIYVSDCSIEGDVDYIWGYGTAGFERCELRTMHDGYIVQARNPANRAGYVFVDCRLTAAPETKKYWLARIDTARFPASAVAFIRCRMDSRVQAAGWQISGLARGGLHFDEFASTDLDGKLLDVSQRDPASRQLADDPNVGQAVWSALAGGDRWNPRRKEGSRNEH